MRFIAFVTLSFVSIFKALSNFPFVLLNSTIRKTEKRTDTKKLFKKSYRVVEKDRAEELKNFLIG